MRKERSRREIEPPGQRERKRIPSSPPARQSPPQSSLLSKLQYSNNIIGKIHTQGGGILERCRAARQSRKRIPSSSARAPPASPIPPSYTISIIYSNITATKGGGI